VSERLDSSGGRVAFSVKEAAEQLGVSEYSVRRAVTEGQLHQVVMNEKRVLIPAWSIDELLARPAQLELVRGDERQDGPNSPGRVSYPGATQLSLRHLSGAAGALRVCLRSRQ
jgi:excisionase family DNA binding protein